MILMMPMMTCMTAMILTRMIIVIPGYLVIGAPGRKVTEPRLDHLWVHLVIEALGWRDYPRISQRELVDTLFP